MFEMKYDKDGLPLKSPQQEGEGQEGVVQPVIQGEEQEIVPQAVEHHTEAPAQQNEVNEKPQSSKEQNLALLRQKAEQLQAERDEARQNLEKYRLKYESPPQQETPSPREDSLGIGDDELVEGKHLTKVSDKIRHLEQQLKKYEEKNTEFTVESRLKSNYPDYFQVVSQENVAKLREHDPDIADAIYHTPDLYKKAALTYKMIKQCGIVKEDKFKKDRELAQQNASKPRSLNSISPQTGSTPMSRANAFADGLTPELKQQLLREMEEARKGY